MPGKMVTVSKRDKMADTIELQLEKKSKFSLGFKSADKILVSG
jgi:Fe2+ transport system protein FeoA